MIELLQLAVEAHNRRPGCPIADCSVCQNTIEAGKRLVEIAFDMGVKVEPAKRWGPDHGLGPGMQEDHRTLYIVESKICDLCGIPDHLCGDRY